MKKLLFVILLTICIIWNGFAQHKVRHHSRLPLFTDPFISMITLKSTEVKLLTATRISFTPHLLTPKKAGMFFTKIVEPQAGHVQSDQDEIDRTFSGTAKNPLLCPDPPCAYLAISIEPPFKNMSPFSPTQVKVLAAAYANAVTNNIIKQISNITLSVKDLIALFSTPDNWDLVQFIPAYNTQNNHINIMVIFSNSTTATAEVKYIDQYFQPAKDGYGYDIPLFTNK